MGTNYYRLQSPFTSMRLEEGTKYDLLTLWIGNVNVGTLALLGGMADKLRKRSQGASRTVNALSEHTAVVKNAAR